MQPTEAPRVLIFSLHRAAILSQSCSLGGKRAKADVVIGFKNHVLWWVRAAHPPVGCAAAVNAAE